MSKTLRKRIYEFQCAQRGSLGEDAFPLEYKLGQIKRLFRKPGAKLSQVVRRIIELQINGDLKETGHNVEAPVLIKDDQSES